MTYHGHHTHAHAHAGSSFFQAPNTHHHSHSHSHSHTHQHVHDQSHRDGDSDSVRSPDHVGLTKRQNPVDLELGLNLDSEPVVVVQTISVLHLIDGNGLVVQISTLPPDPIPAPATGVSVVAAAQTIGAGVDLGSSLGVSVGLDLPATSTISAPTPTSSGTATVSDSSPSGPTTTAETVHVTNSSSSSSTSTETILTSTPLTTSMGYPSFTAPYNSTNPRQSSLFSNGTLFRTLFANSTTSAPTSTTLYTISTDASVQSSVGDGDASLSPAVFSIAATPTTTAESGSFVGGSSGTRTQSATPTDPVTPPGLAPEARNAVIGGVVGGIAGMALLVFLAMVVLRWKRRQVNGISRLRDRSSSVTGRGLSAPPSGNGGDSGSTAMVQHSNAPFMIPSALARLTGYSRASQAESLGPPSEERGFYRVSGKKLQPVIQSGGDGYSDPHDSIATDASFYRNSHGYFGESGTLQLGSPMRPESGIPVMRTGPGRTPMKEQGPFSDHAHPLVSPSPPLTPPPVDPLGRSLISQDGSRGSGSRFTEDI